MISAAAATANASGIQMWGAFGFGVTLGWFLYFLNRYRREVTLADLTTVIGAIGGAGILALFPAKTDLFGAYGVGLATGFFCYFLVVVGLVSISENFNIDYLIDGRRKEPEAPYGYGEQPDRPMARISGAGEQNLPKGT